MHPFLENPNISAFLGKLWKMVNDPGTDHVISWSESGNTFIIHNQAQFWYELLPVYYKHNNMSSFVRQLNMYGFHKINNMVNPRSDKEDQSVQFYNPYFQKGKPERLRDIKRKATSAKPNEEQGIIRSDHLSKVLTDVKQLRGRQTSVDSQLTAMKQENAVLWRELAILRQKHVKQQQIVNKLIQFLVTLVQPPATPRMGVGVKRRMPLMLHESPTKKSRKANRHRDAGPTIHELDPKTSLSPEQLLEEASGMEEEDMPLESVTSNLGKSRKIDSPITPKSQLGPDESPRRPTPSPVTPSNDAPNNRSINNDDFWVKPEFVTIDAIDDMSENEEELIDSLQRTASPAEKVFLNPNNRDTLIGSHMSPTPLNAANSIGGKSLGNGKSAIQPVSGTQASSGPPPTNVLQIAQKEPDVKINSEEDLDLHVGSTQNELDQLKDILNGCNNFDANTLLGLFSENDTFNDAALPSKENPAIEGVPGNEEAASSNELIDFTELLDDDLNLDDSITTDAQPGVQASSTLNTPVRSLKNGPSFPVRS